jgi:hypothetical protein
MDFIEEQELYNSAMDNAYNLITGRMTLEDMFIEFEEEEEEDAVDMLPIPFNPFLTAEYSDSTIDVVIEHFSALEEYEKCAELVEIKENNAKKHK